MKQAMPEIIIETNSSMMKTCAKSQDVPQIFNT
jgi:hypothetical protein